RIGPYRLHAVADELFKHDSKAGYLEELFFCESGHSRSSAGSALDESFFGKSSERFANRNVTDTKSRGESALDEAFAGGEFATLDCFTHLVGHFVGDALVC